MKNLVFVIAMFMATLLPAQPNFDLVGFATQNGGTTGGQGGTVVTAKTFAELKSYAESNTKYIINVEGTIKNGTTGGKIQVKSNKSIIGVGSTAFLSCVGIEIENQNNIIIQNIKISLVGLSDPGTVNGGDCIVIMGTSKNVWVDHCELFSEDPDKQPIVGKYDGLLDIRDQTGFITVSWNYFHDHWKGGLVGAGDDDLYADRKVTYHHNYYNKVKLRVPMYRGATGHFFNNYVKDANSPTEIRAGTCVRVEKNYYENFENAIYTPNDSKGSTERIDNYLSKTQPRAFPANCTANITYNYSNVLTTKTTDVKTIVPQYSGVGKIGACTAKTWYKDSDGDGFGDPNSTQSSCLQPTGYVEDKTDLCPNDVNKVAAGQCGCGVAETVCLDCNGVKNGTATLDNCGRCIGGNTGKTACSSVGEAESDACAFDGITETKNSGFKGTSYVNVDNALGTSITFHVNANVAGSATLSFRYANGSTTDRPAQVSLNGNNLPSNLSFLSTGSFTDWKAVDITFNLLAGQNIIKLVSATADGLPNIDQIGYVSTSVSKGGCVVTSIEDISTDQHLSIFPNPSKTHFTIVSENNIDLQIVDLDGKIQEEHKGVSNVLVGSSLKAGIYFLKIKNKVYKLVKE